MSKNDRFFVATHQVSKIGLPQQRPGGATGTPTGRPNRNIAVPQTPAATFAGAQTSYDAYTYLTQVGEAKGGGAFTLYNGDRTWAEVVLTLQTAGPVAVGRQAQLFPVTSGRGILLATDQPKTFKVAKGDRIYIASTAVNLVQVEIRAFPWLEQIAGESAAIHAVLNLIASR